MTTTQHLDAALSGRYQLEREIGAGGMATVYLARDLRHERRVAIKVLHPELSAVLGAERFLAEIRLTAALQHPHILPLHDSGEANGLVFYVMPFVDGESLRDRLRREMQLPVDEAVRIAREVASALDYAHRRGVVHRDIKPENILLHDGQALVADFGIALAVNAVGGGTRLTETGMSLGTPHYMSPEQAMGERDITARSDVYALGCVLYEMLVGEPPFTGPTAQAIVARVMTEEPRPLAAQRKTIPAHVDAAVRTALAKLPADRFATAAEFAAALSAPGYTSGRTAAHRTPAPPATGSLLRMLPWLVATGAMGAAAWAFARDAREPRAPAIRAAFPVGDSASIASVQVLPGDSLLVVFGDGGRGQWGLSLVRLATGEVVPLRGTEDGLLVSAAPDGRSLAFVARGQLWRMSLPNGAPMPLAPVKSPTCVAWGTDDRIAVCEDEGLNVTVVPAVGGAKDTLSHEGPTPRQFRSVFPLSEGRLLGNSGDITSGAMWVLHERRARLVTHVGVVDTATPGGAVNAPSGKWAQQLPGGYLAWITAERALMVAPIDPRSLRQTGPTVIIADSVESAHFGTRGLLALIRGPNLQEGVLVIADRSGRLDTLPHPRAAYRTFDISPDGRRLAVVVANGLTTELRLLDVGRAASRVLPVRAPHEPRWSPDGRRIAVMTGRGGQGALLLIDPDNARHVDTLAQDNFVPHAWSPDGQEIAGSLVDGTGYGILARLRPGVDTTPRRVDGAGSNSWYQSFSPDGRWYVFSATGFRADQAGIYAAENREGAVPTRIAPEHFDNPIWAPDGRSIIVMDYRTGHVSAIPVRSGASPEFDSPVPLFSAARHVEIAGIDMHVLRDGRVAFIDGAPRAPIRSITLLTDWRAEYARRAISVAR